MPTRAFGSRRARFSTLTPLPRQVQFLPLRVSLSILPVSPPVHDDTASGSPAMPPPKRPARTPSKPPPSATSVRSRAVTINDEKPTDQPSVGPGAKTSQHERASRRPSNTYTLRIEHATHPTLEIGVSSAADKPTYLALTNFSIRKRTSSRTGHANLRSLAGIRWNN